MAKVRLLSSSGEVTHELEVVKAESGEHTVRRASALLGADHRVSVSDSGTYSLLSPHGSYEADVEVEEELVVVSIAGERFEFRRADARRSGVPERSGGPAKVRSPMPGKVVKLLVDEGHSVDSGQGVLLFEAMKMQNEIRSPVAGTVQSIAVEEGQTVDSKVDLFTVSPSTVQE